MALLRSCCRALRNREIVVPHEQGPALQRLGIEARFQRRHDAAYSLEVDVGRRHEKISEDLLEDCKLLEVGIGMALPNPLVGDESHVPWGSIAFIVFHNHSVGQQLLGLRLSVKWALKTLTQRAQYPLIKEYGLHYIGFHIMI